MYSSLVIVLDLINCVNSIAESNFLGLDIINKEQEHNILNEDKNKPVPKARFKDFVAYKKDKIKRNVGNKFDKLNKKVEDFSLYKSAKNKLFKKKNKSEEKTDLENKEKKFSLCGSTGPDGKSKK